MAKYKKTRTGLVFLIIFIALAISAVAVTLSSYDIIEGVPTWNNVLGQEDTSEVAKVGENKDRVCFIDCGQGDCETLISGEHVTVIDSGPQSTKHQTIQQLKDLGITNIENLILTHPHEDHIGGAYDILDNFNVSKIYMVKPSKSNTPKTKVYLNLLEKISSKGLSITQPEIGGTIQSGDFKMKFLSPDKVYDDHNNNSIVIRADVDNKSFLFTGDAEKEPENQMLKKYRSDLDCDVLKVGHHGSPTSTSDNFLKAVSPSIAVIEVGTGNDYGHPKGSTLKKLSNCKIYRTDLNGMIVITVDNRNLNVITQKEKSQ